MLSHEKFKRNLRILASSAILVGGYYLLHNADAATLPKPVSDDAAVIAALPLPWFKIRSEAITEAYKMRRPQIAIVENSRYCQDLPDLIGRAWYGNPYSFQVYLRPRKPGGPVYCAVARRIAGFPHAMSVTVYQLFPFNVVSTGAVMEDFANAKGVK
ncbi:hypothetical protein [Acidiphilium acidophilum]|uniref:hypothetical protein n=1 Tax=Acidiphilium acidophilum TaxID=76588 RepID=UPI002E8E7267|nr:hypothetical protein [Acidiphilium acidophilum]